MTRFNRNMGLLPPPSPASLPYIDKHVSKTFSAQALILLSSSKLAHSASAFSTHGTSDSGADAADDARQWVASRRNNRIVIRRRSWCDLDGTSVLASILRIYLLPAALFPSIRTCSTRVIFLQSVSFVFLNLGNTAIKLTNFVVVFQANTRYSDTLQIWNLLKLSRQTSSVDLNPVYCVD